jgi:hypothetical protein
MMQEYRTGHVSQMRVPTFLSKSLCESKNTNKVVVSELLNKQTNNKYIPGAKIRRTNITQIQKNKKTKKQQRDYLEQVIIS